MLSAHSLIRARRALATAIVVAVPFSASGCSGNDGPPAPIDGSIVIEGSAGSLANILSLLVVTGAWGEGGTGGPVNGEVAVVEVPPPPPPEVLQADLVVPLPAADFAPGQFSVGLFAGGRLGGSASTSARLRFSRDSLESFQMLTARVDHAMAPLPARRVLVSGGYGAGTPAPINGTAEVFNFTTRTFAAVSPMRVARAAHAAATLSDGRVLLTGGVAPVGAGGVAEVVATTELFNSGTGVFSDGPAMTTARANHSAIALNDGRVLVLGGDGERSAEIYNPGSNTFTALPNMTSIRGNGHVAVKLLNGKVLVTGGDVGGDEPTAVVELFDPGTNRFSVVGNTTTARMFHFVVVIPNGRVVIGGGRGSGGQGLSTVEVYDPNSHTFSSIAPLPVATFGAPAAYVGANGGG